MIDRATRRLNWQRFKQKKRQISMTLSIAEYRYWNLLAKRNGVKIGQQIKAEAIAYGRQERVPEAALLTKLSEHTHILRGIGNNLNQIARHSNSFRKFIHHHQTIKLLRKLEAAAESFVRGK